MRGRGEEGEALRTVRLARPDDVEGWRAAARAHLAADVPPEAIVWEVGAGTPDLFAAGTTPLPSPAASPPAASPGGDAAGGGSRGPGRGPGRGAAAARVPPVPASFLELAERVVCHRDPDRFALLYRVLWRRARGERSLLDAAADPDVYRLQRLGWTISRERHKMHAFVRFRQTPGVAPEHFGAWFEPEHHTLRLASGFFVRRFANMRWSIVTPEESAHWDTRTLAFGPGGRRGVRDEAEEMERLWQTYFANVFNPARLRLDAMRAEMPIKYWKNLPEAPLIASLVREAGRRASGMIEAAPSVPPRYAAKAEAPHPERRQALAGALPEPRGGPSPPGGHVPERFADLAALHERTRRCERCELACRATQAVNGEGRAGAPLMIVGEQPGDREDLAGRPFVGPAGALLRRLLAELEVAEESVYLTNAVRHFRHEPRGKRRLHRRPGAEHADRCRPWLFEEIRLVRPRAIVALGATAARALSGRPVVVERERGRAFAFGAGMTLWFGGHPAAILRAPDEPRRAALAAALRDDLAAAVASLGATVG